MQVTIWTLIASPPDFLVAVWLDDNLPQVSVGSMVPLLLKSGIKQADIRAFLLYRLWLCGEEGSPMVLIVLTACSTW